MFKNQDDAPICKSLQDYKQKEYLPFTVPGHKRGKGVDAYSKEILGAGTYSSDIPLEAGLDDRKESRHVRSKAEALAAEAFGADRTFFSVNGSSLSVHAAIMAVADPGDVVLMTRNGHKSLIAACIFAGVKPVFIENKIDKEYDLEMGIDPDELDNLLDRHPEAEAVFIVSPTYYGIAADVETLAKVCHKHNTCLVVDEAWGPHFSFHPDLPKPAMKCGADISISSIHKMLNGLGQASVINYKGPLIEPERVELAVRFFESTSPSSLIMASIDSARRFMALEGKEVWSKVLQLSQYAREEISKITNLEVLSDQLIGKPGAHAFDYAKLVIEVKKLGITGFTAADWLQDEERIIMELADNQRIMGIITPADNQQSIDRLIASIKKMTLWARGREKENTTLPPLETLRTECVMSPRDAFYQTVKSVSLADAVDEIAAETITPYPPGIPRLIPGELITKEIVQFLQQALKEGMYIDALDPELKLLRVVKHEKTKRK